MSVPLSQLVATVLILPCLLPLGVSRFRAQLLSVALRQEQMYAVIAKEALSTKYSLSIIQVYSKA